jgi:hypothetical protein
MGNYLILTFPTPLTFYAPSLPAGIFYRQAKPGLHLFAACLHLCQLTLFRTESVLKGFGKVDEVTT